MLITLFSVLPFFTVPVQVLWMEGVKFIVDAVAGLSKRRLYFDEDQSVWDTWWTQWQGDRFLTEFFDVVCHYPSSIGP